MAPFTLQDAYQLQREGKTMTAKKAHAFLKAWRAKHSRPAAPQGDGGPAAPQGNAPWGMQQPRKPLVAFALEVEDLTESPHFDWRAYVAARTPADLAAVFEDQSIERFDIRFIKPVDRNCNQHRCDFIAHRTDGVLVRFHPSQAQDAIPVLAVWADICITSLPDFQGRELGWAGPAAPQGEEWAMPQARGVYHAVSRHDTMSKNQGISFLLEKQRLIEAEQWRRRFWEDLTDQTEFPWSYLVAGLRGGQEVLQAGVDQFALCWVGGEWKRPAFYIREACGRESVLLLTTRAVWNAEAVAHIDWC